MAIFQIQNSDGTLSSVSHDEFYEALNGEVGYLYYKQGGSHIAMLPTEENAETLRVCRQEDNAEYETSDANARCRDEKGQVCRYQHDADGRVIRNEKGYAVRAKCSDCPRDGWIGGKRENCCIRNYCRTPDCAYCTNHREYNAPISLDWLPTEHDYSETDSLASLAADPAANIQAAMENEELESALLAAIGELSPKERAVLKAVYWEKLSVRDYAAESGMSKSTVHRLHNRALELLKMILKDFS
jgi:RNA polymerase sigma factor (sigma-70 family)